MSTQITGPELAEAANKTSALFRECDPADVISHIFCNADVVFGVVPGGFLLLKDRPRGDVFNWTAIPLSADHACALKVLAGKGTVDAATIVARLSKPAFCRKALEKHRDDITPYDFDFVAHPSASDMVH